MYTSAGQKTRLVDLSRLVKCSRRLDYCFNDDRLVVRPRLQHNESRLLPLAWLVVTPVRFSTEPQHLPFPHSAHTYSIYTARIPTHVSTQLVCGVRSQSFWPLRITIHYTYTVGAHAVRCQTIIVSIHTLHAPLNIHHTQPVAIIVLVLHRLRNVKCICNTSVLTNWCDLFLHISFISAALGNMTPYRTRVTVIVYGVQSLELTTIQLGVAV